MVFLHNSLVPTPRSGLRVLLVDHADSFTWNLANLLHVAADAVGVDLDLAVVRDGELDLPRLVRDPPGGVVLSPGPNGPEQVPESCELVRALAGRRPILGVCLGMQIVAHALGGRVVRAPTPVHGKQARVTHDGLGLFAQIPQEFEVMRYHSLVVERLPPGLVVTAHADGLPMALRGVGIEAVQFHPESVGTPLGLEWAGAAVRWMAAQSPLDQTTCAET
jgi:anthranilate synthase/aminodeoxychorismate synthase-like glutamine amidotransferase